VLDVLVDLRKESPSYGNAAAAMLSGANHHLFFVPLGVAHGFLSLEMGSVMVYKTSTVHAPSCDAGIRWDSFGFDWGVTSPIVSIRDQAFPSLAELASPF
jgi:dTDP-4-dehydrorhamnose 3,5-epimerase-like enzyme